MPHAAPSIRRRRFLLLLAALFAGGFLGGRLIAFGQGPGSWIDRSPPNLSRFDEPLLAAAREFQLDPDLLRGLVAAESSGDPSAVSGKDAVGLLQLTVTTAEEQAKALRLEPPDRGDLKAPALNLRLGARYVSRLLAEFSGDEAFALAAYNAGSTPVKRWRLRAADVSSYDAVMREGFSETKNLVARALRFRDAYRSSRR